ncbi:MAG: acetyl-CoA carboxylase biotin carboxyl carrier protein [Alphaproteobacteria bacterium]|nr:acetyl-CoA carboxylase biotin carboxyl carrier protein [Alphaproteobacteria bacterium]
MSKDTKASNDPLEARLIRDLAGILEETGLTEIEIEKAGLRVRVARNVSVSAVAAVAPAPVAAAPVAAAVAPAAPKAAETAGHPGLVTSPMVGTAYLAPSPGAAPFVKVGDTVKEGQTLLIIEAMKTMNQIPAPRAGRVTKVIVNDGQPVEYGEPMMIIE